MSKENMKENLMALILIAVVVVGGAIYFSLDDDINGEYTPSERCLEIVEHEHLMDSIECRCVSPENFDVDANVSERVRDVTYVNDVIVCSTELEEDLVFPLREINESALEETDLDESDIEDDIDMLD